MDEKGNVLKTLKVLLVEDEPDIREGISRFLKRRVNLLVVAVNGKEGLETFKSERSDIIISDIRMPVMDGLTMIRSIREFDTEIPVIVTTGHSDEKFLLEAINIGVDRYLKKPVIYEDLVSALNRLGMLVFQKRELARKNQLLQMVLNHSSQFFLILDEDLDIIYMNEPLSDYVGCKDLNEFKDSDIRLEDFLVRNDDLYIGNKNFRQIFSEMIEHPEMDYTVRMRSREGWQDDENTFLMTLRPIQEGEQYLVSFTDVTMMEMVRSLYREQATRDPLTRILNRKKFFDELQSEMERSKRYGSLFSLIMMDIDHFKSVNDTYGHQAGDKVLLTLVKLIKSRIRRLDKFGRYGGEEFILLLPATSLDNAVDLAEALRALIEEYKFDMPNITVSFGVASFHGHESLDDLVKRVDRALYSAKSNGRNRVEVDEELNIGSKNE